jgi:hypothetical protein
VPVAALGVTVAKKVTNCPDVDGFCEEVRFTLDDGVVTVWESAADVLAVSLASPPYDAVIGCVPTDKLDIDKVAEPPVIATVPSAVVPSRN